jgi:hypothetical protein
MPKLRRALNSLAFINKNVYIPINEEQRIEAVIEGTGGYIR